MKKTTETNATDPAADEVRRVLARVYRFARRDLAFAFAGRCEKAMWVMLGDDGRFWAATPADCARLERAGYEWAD